MNTAPNHPTAGPECVPERLYTGPFWLLNLLNFITLSTTSAFFLFPEYLQDLGYREGSIGLVMGIYPVAAFTLRPWIGNLVDVQGRLRYLRWGQAIMAASCLLYVVGPDSAAWFSLVRFIHGAGMAAYFTAVFTLAADACPPGRLAEGLGIFGVSGLLAHAFGPWSGEMVLKVASFPVLLLILCGACGVGILLSLPIRECRPMLHHQERRGALHLLGQSNFWPAVLAAIIFGTASGAITTFIAPYSHWLALGGVGGFFLAYALAAILVRLFSSFLVDRVLRQGVIIPAFCLIALGLWGIAGLHSWPMLMLMGALAGAGHGLIYPSLNALVLERAGAADRGAAMSLFTGSVDFGNFAGSVAYGQEIEMVGYRSMYSTAALVVVVCMLGFALAEFMIGRAKRKTL